MMRKCALFPVVAGILTAACGQTFAQHEQARKPPLCRAITPNMLSRPLVLPEGCYTVNQFTNVGHPLQISPGSTIIFGGGAALSIETNGSLDAGGTAEKPIIFRGTDGTAGSWSGLSIASRSSSNRLSYVTVEDAGLKGTDNAALLLAPGASLSIDHSTVRRSLGTGILVIDNAAFSHFESNHFLNTDTPLRIKATDAASIDAETTFAGNTNNVVAIPFGEGKLDERTLWHKLAVPYRFEASLEVGAPLTIEAGAQLQFRENLMINVVQNGSLAAVGTAEAPIVFTGTDETPGYWGGIFFASASSGNVLRHVDVRFGGSKNSVVGGAVGITHHASAVVQSSSLSSSPIGIFVASEGVLNADAPSSNHFQDVGQSIVVER